MTELLITEAMNYAKKNGAKYVEAYPVDPDSPSYRFMGYKSTFERMDSHSDIWRENDEM